MYKKDIKIENQKIKIKKQNLDMETMNLKVVKC